MHRLFSLCLIVFALIAGAQSNTTHVVKRGETFASVAEKYGITEQELLDFNPNKKNCYVGLKLIIPAPGQESPKAKKATPQLLTGRYYIQNDFDHLSQELFDEADSGNVVAIKELADCYRWGSDVVPSLQIKKDIKKAITLYLQADSAGYPYAAWELGCMYAAGSAVPQDLKKAALWYNRAFDCFQDFAERKDPRAMFYLADYYLSPSLPGNADRADPKMASYWYREAVKTGDPSGAAVLADYYRLGWGFDKDEQEAMKWDARFCIEAEKKGWRTEDHSSYTRLKEAGKSNEEDWKALAKDTYKDNPYPLQVVESAVIEQVAATPQANSQKDSTPNPTNNHPSISQTQQIETGVASNVPRVVSGDGFLTNYCVNCSQCGGTGQMNCENCNGLGYFRCNYITPVYNFRGAFMMPTMMHPNNCPYCHNTGRVPCLRCGSTPGKQACRLCSGLKQIVKYTVKDIPIKASRPEKGCLPANTKLQYVSVAEGFRGARDIKTIDIDAQGNVRVYPGATNATPYRMVDNGDTWLMVNQEKYMGIGQRYLAKNHSIFIECGKLYVLWPPEDVQKQYVINNNSTFLLQAATSAYYGGSSSTKENSIAQSLKQEVAEIEARQNARSRQERSDAHLNVALAQTNREVYCPKCRSWGLKHTHY